MIQKPQREIIVQQGNVEEGYLHVTGGRVWYRIVGREQTRLPLLCVHGGPGVPHDYLTPMELLADERPVILFDQLGCGNSDRPDDISLWHKDFFADEIDEVRAGLGLEELFFFGQSWGSMLGAYYLINRTQKGIRAVIFGGPVMNSKMMTDDCAVLVNQMSPENAKAVWDAEAAHDYSSPGFAAAIQEFYHKHVCRLDPWPDYVRRGEEMTGFPVYNTMWGPSEFLCTGNLQDFDMTPELAKIQVPVLFTCGEYDECRPATISKFHMAVPYSKMAVIADASHMHHVEKPQEYRQLVSAWLKRFE